MVTRNRKLPHWIKATKFKMYCWRQTQPVTVPFGAPRNDYWLLQFSTFQDAELTLFIVQDKQRKPVAIFDRYFFKSGEAIPSKRFSQLQVSFRQAFIDEALFGTCSVSGNSVGVPPPISFSTDNSRVEVVNKEEESSDEE